jgi:hypothetical protein
MFRVGYQEYSDPCRLYGEFEVALILVLLPLHLIQLAFAISPGFRTCCFGIRMAMADPVVATRFRDSNHGRSLRGIQILLAWLARFQIETQFMELFGIETNSSINNKTLIVSHIP